MALRTLMLTSAVWLGVAGAAGAQAQWAFDDLDADADGFVTAEELTAVADEEAATRVIEEQDLNDDGMIDREEAGADGSITDPLDEGEEDDDD